MDQYRNLLNAYKKDPDIDELGFVLEPVAADTNGIILVEHKLGIPFQCAVEIYAYAHAKFMQARKLAQGLSTVYEPDVAKNLAECTRVMLTINGSCYTTWNTRKQLILQGYLTDEDELKFIRVLFTKHPKCPEAWAHRRWIVARLHKNGSKGFELGDLELCTRVAGIYPKNYYAWSHRSWALYLFRQDPDYVQEDFAQSLRWTEQNVSDHCGFQHLQLVLTVRAQRHDIHKGFQLTPTSNVSPQAVNTLTDEDRLASEACLEWLEEAKRVVRLLVLYPEHEAMWVHLRAIILGTLLLSIDQGSIVQFNAAKKDLLATRATLKESKRVKEAGSDHFEALDHWLNHRGALLTA